MQKAYSRIIYKNYPSTDTPLNETNLNHMDGALDTIDDRVVAMDTTKANQADMLQAIKTISYDETTGVFTITFFNNTSITIDTDIEKIAINFDYDDDPTSAHYQQIIIELDDGTKKYIDLSALITQYEFTNSSTVAFTISGGNVSASVIDGSITEAKLQPNFLADVKAEVAKAEDFSEDAEAWAKGTRGGDPVESTDPTHNNNAKHYSEVASDEKDSAEAWANGEINGVPVPDTHPAHNNNAKYYKDLANPTTFKALTDVTTDQNFNGIDMTGIQDGQTIVFDNTTGEMVPGDAGGAAINDMFNVYGSKNLIPYPYYDKTYASDVSVDDDGIITFDGVSAGLDDTLHLVQSDYQDNYATALRLPAGRYTFSTDWDDSVLQIKLSYGSSLSDYNSITLVGTRKSQSFDLAANQFIMEIFVYSTNPGYVFSNAKVKIMLRRASIKDDTYEPYALTNQQLTKKHNVKDMNDAVINNPTPGQTLVYNSDGKLENATPSGSGHTILNSAGTALTPRTNLQFAGGLNATDDSNNNKSVVDDNYEIIPWITWQGYTDAQKTQHPNAIITDAPDCDGDVEIETMHLAWENSSPSSNFPQSAITLDDSACPNYTNIRIEYCLSTSNGQFNSIDVPIDQTFNMGLSYLTATAINGSYIRVGIHNKSNKSIYFYGGWEITANGIDYGRDDCIIPIRVYIYSKTLTARIKAIAHDVSTSASKCMMSDGVTSVEDAINNYSPTEHLVGHWYGLPLYEKTISMGAAPNNSNLAVAHGITNLAAIVDIRGVAIRVNPFQVIPLPHATNPVTNNIQLYADATNVNMSTYADLSVFAYCYITIRYTKS